MAAEVGGEFLAFRFMAPSPLDPLPSTPFFAPAPFPFLGLGGHTGGSFGISSPAPPFETFGTLLVGTSAWVRLSAGLLLFLGFLVLTPVLGSATIVETSLFSTGSSWWVCSFFFDFAFLGRPSVRAVCSLRHSWLPGCPQPPSVDCVYLASFGIPCHPCLDLCLCKILCDSHVTCVPLKVHVRSHCLHPLCVCVWIRSSV